MKEIEEVKKKKTPKKKDKSESCCSFENDVWLFCYRISLYKIEGFKNKNGYWFVVNRPIYTAIKIYLF